VRGLARETVQERDPLLESDEHDLDPFALASQQLAVMRQLIAFANKP
jgi:hypothetical protein